MSFDIARVRELRPQNEFHYFPSVQSTMSEAASLASIGAPHGTVVLAGQQTNGIGRFGRSWISEPEVGIYTSILLRLPLPSTQVPIVSLLLGLSISDAIKKSANLTCDLRWPNDVLLRERKVAGTLARLTDNCIIAGIGINVNSTAFPENLRTPATSLLLADGGRPHSRELLLVQLLQSLDTFSNLLLVKGPQSILDAFSAASSYVKDRRILIEESGLHGLTQGLDEHGFLLVRLAAGEVHPIVSGGIRPDTESPR